MHLSELEQMYRKADQSEPTPENFELPFSGKLSSDNRWVIMAELIPWSEFESEFLKLPHGIPSDDTFRRLFERINPIALSECLTKSLH